MAVATWGFRSCRMAAPVRLQQERLIQRDLLLYSAFTCCTGFKVNSGEYNVMGLAPYGEPKYSQTVLDRGYERFDARLRAVGTGIERLEE